MTLAGLIMPVPVRIQFRVKGFGIEDVGFGVISTVFCVQVCSGLSSGYDLGCPLEGS